MGMDFTRHALGPGVNLYTQYTTKYKTTAVYVYLHAPLAADSVTSTALVPMILSRGSRTLPSTAAIATHLENLYGAALGSDVAQRGEVQSLVFRLDIANEKFIPGESGLLERGVQTLAGVLLDPLLREGGFAPDYVQQEKANLGSMIDSLINNKQGYALQRCREALCPNEPYSLHRYGRKADLAQITPQGLYQHYQHLLRTAPVDLFVVGDLPEEQAVALVSRYLRFPDGERRLPTTQVVRQAGEWREVKEAQPVNQGVLVVGMRTGVTLSDPAYFPFLLAGMILGGYSHSKLFEEVREKHSLAYSAYAIFDSSKGVGQMFAGIDFANYGQTLDIMLAQLKALQAGEISDYEMDATVRSLISDVLSAEDRVGQMVNMAVTGLLAGNPRTLQEQIAGIRSVTREQAAEAARLMQPEVVYFLTRPEGEA